MASMLFNASGVRAQSPPSGSPIPHGVHPLKLQAQTIDIEAVKAKYEAERAKRFRADGMAQFNRPKGRLSHFTDDVATPEHPRDPIVKETKALIVGAGFAGMITAVKLKKDHGIDDYVLVDRASGFGGTWYWNQYPGMLPTSSLNPRVPVLTSVILIQVSLVMLNPISIFLFWRRRATYLKTAFHTAPRSAST